MKRGLVFVATSLLLAGCLEVEQHPPWQDGAYDGKPDQRVAATRFGGDRRAWSEAITARTQFQDEYLRTGR